MSVSCSCFGIPRLDTSRGGDTGVSLPAHTYDVLSFVTPGAARLGVGQYGVYLFWSNPQNDLADSLLGSFFQLYVFGAYKHVLYATLRGEHTVGFTDRLNDQKNISDFGTVM